jgi:hypothetical protein
MVLFKHIYLHAACAGPILQSKSSLSHTRLSSRRVLHYDFHRAIPSQGRSLCGLDALWHGLQYLFQWFVEEELVAVVHMTLTRFRVRCWNNDCHLGRQTVQRVLPYDPKPPGSSCRYSMGIYRSCSALCWWHFSQLCWSSLGFADIHCVDVHWGVSVAILKLTPTVVHYADPKQNCPGRPEYLRYPTLWPPAHRAWLWMRLHRFKPVRCRMRASQTPWQFCWHRLPIRVPVRYSDRFLGWIWHDILRESVQYRLESLEHHSNSYRPHICCSVFLLSRKVGFPCDVCTKISLLTGLQP